MPDCYTSRKALVIGVSRYSDPQYDLSYARSDAEAMAELLGNEFGFDQVWTLYDADATRQNLLRFFEQDLQQTGEDDGLLIFFAGHGITVTSTTGDDHGFLVPHDGNPKQNFTNLSLTAIRDVYLQMIPAKHVFLIVDACYSGLALRDADAVKRTKIINDALVAELTRHKVRQVLAAGMKDQRVLDGGLFGHSVFTGRLIESLREANPYITSDHVGAHVRERVAQDSLDRKHRQTPQFGNLTGSGGSFVFHRRAARHQNASAVPTAPDATGATPQTSERSEASTRTDVSDVRRCLNRFVQERCGRWSKKRLQEFLLTLYEDGTATGWPQSEILSLLEDEKLAWMQIEARRKAEESRLAAAAREAAKDAKRKAEEARKAEERAQEEEFWQRCAAARTEQAINEYLRSSKLRTYESQARVYLAELKEEAKRKTEEVRKAEQRAKEAQKAEKQAAEEQLWQRCKSRGTEEDIREYLRVSKLRSYQSEAHAILTVLKDEAERKKKPPEAARQGHNQAKHEADRLPEHPSTSKATTPTSKMTTREFSGERTNTLRIAAIVLGSRLKCWLGDVVLGFSFAVGITLFFSVVAAFIGRHHGALFPNSDELKPIMLFSFWFGIAFFSPVFWILVIRREDYWDHSTFLIVIPAAIILLFAEIQGQFISKFFKEAHLLLSGCVYLISAFGSSYGACVLKRKWLG